MKVTREIKTAILVISAILLFIWGYSFLKGRDLFTDYRTFNVYYDNVEGLSPSAPVTISGLSVGKVSGIELMHDTGKLRVELQIKSDFPISKTSVVNLYEPGLIGGKQIQIIPDLNNPQMAESGDTLQGGNVPGLTAVVAGKLAPLQDKVEKMVVSADVLLKNLNSVMDAKTRQNLQNSIANLNATLSEFRAAGQKANTLLDANSAKMNSTFTNLDKASGNFANISDSIAKADLGKTIRELQASLDKFDSIMADAQSGKGTLGKLLKDESLYQNLDKSSRELELLLQDIRLNPTRYVNISVFGKKNKPYKAPKPSDTITIYNPQ